MYKIVVNNIVVDVVKKLRYIRYIPELNRVVVTTASAAQAICGSNNKTFYALPNISIHKKKAHWPVATIIHISESEYEELKYALSKDNNVVSDYVLDNVRKEKVAELSTYCKEAIISGFTCMLSDKREHHFKLTIEDQINLLDVQREFDSGAETIIFHATNELCQVYSRSDIEIILTEASLHKKKQTTYFNVLKNCIYNIYDIETIKAIKYGDSIKELPVSIIVDSSIEELL